MIPIKIGIVLPVYDQEEQYIYEAILAIEAQTYRNFKLIIILDGPNQQTVRSLYAAASHLTIPYAIINRSVNKGFAYSLNEGFARLTECSYITWVSSDDRPHPHFLERLLHAMETAPINTIIVYSLYFHINELGERIHYPDEYYEFMQNFMSRSKEQINQISFIGVSHLFSREAYLKAGGYDPSYGVVADYEFWIRLLQTGEIRLIHEFLFEYRINGKYSHTTNTSAEQLILKSMRASYDQRIKTGDIPKVTILLPVHNQQQYIDRAIHSVLEQTFTNFHLVIINDGSTDLTATKLHSLKDSRIMSLYTAQHQGKASALNLGLTYALGQYVLEMDGDDWLDPQALAVLVEHMDSQPAEVGMVYANHRIWFQQKTTIAQGPIMQLGQLHNKYELLVRLATPVPRLYRKSALEFIGGWQTQLHQAPCIAEDLLTMLYLSENFKFHWINLAVYHQRIHEQCFRHTHREHLSEQRQAIVRYMLIRWNSPYIPEFVIENGEVKKVKLH